MSEHDEEVNQSLGISRRTLLRRGAVVGGTLMWTAPMVKSLTPAAFGQAMGQSPGGCAACYCYSGDISNPSKDVCATDGFDGFFFNRDTCENYCKHQSGYNSTNGAPGGPYTDYQYCSGVPTTDPERTCACRSKRAGFSSNFGVNCPPT